MKNFDNFFYESIPVHQNPLGPIEILDEESSSKTKRDSNKICFSLESTPEMDANALSFFEITLHRGRVAQGHHRTC